MKVRVILSGVALLLSSIGARADIVSDWAATTTEIATDGPNTVRTMALAQSAVYEAVNTITARYPRDHVDLGPVASASMDAAIAAASRAVLIFMRRLASIPRPKRHTHARSVPLRTTRRGPAAFVWVNVRRPMCLPSTAMTSVRSSRIDRSRLPACTYRRLSPWAMR